MCRLAKANMQFSQGPEDKILNETLKPIIRLFTLSPLLPVVPNVMRYEIT